MSSVTTTERVREVGKIVTPLAIANRGDQTRALSPATFPLVRSVPRRSTL